MSNVPTINLFDSTFGDNACSVAGKTPRLMRYVHGQPAHDGVTLFVDGWIYSPAVDQVDSRSKVAWLHEGRELHPENYARIHEVAHMFDLVLTYDEQLLASDPETFKLAIRGGVWTPRAQWGMYPKSKNVSMILSDKRTTSGHQLRHQIAETVPGIDLYGPRHTPIGHDKALAYRDYRYAIVVEAERSNNLFSEHLLDAIAFGCVVMYWGCPNIHDFLDGWGIVPFDDLVELGERIQHRTGIAGDAYYDIESRAPLRLQGWLHDYEITEDWLVQHPLRPLLQGGAL